VHKNPLVAGFDLVTVLMMMFLILALTDKPKQPTVPTFGQFAVTITWKDKSNDDVDLYVRDPSGNIAYFGYPSIGLMHLEQDDLGYGITGYQTLPNGRSVTVTYNGERTVISGIIPGEYTVNVHMYRKSDPGPTTVDVSLWSLRGSDEVLLHKIITLEKSGDEVTVWRFTANERGEISDVNSRPVTLVYNKYSSIQGSNP